MTPVSKIQDLIGRVFNPRSIALDISVQDQTTTPIDFSFLNIQGSPTTLLSAITTVDATTFVYTFDVVASDDMDVGDTVGIFKDSDLERFFFAEITVISSATGNATITVSTPLDFNFPEGSTVASFVKTMNVDGSSTPVIFQVEIGPASDEKIDITNVTLQMKTDTPVSLALFGDLPELSKGIVLRKVTSEGVIQNIWTIKNNAEFALLDDSWVPYAALNPAQGQDGMVWTYSLNGFENHGVVIRLNPGDKLQIVIQDNLLAAQASAKIASLFATAKGHFVDM